MSSKLPSREQLFRDWRSGDSSALEHLFALERPLIYDFLLRMTGQVARAWDTIDEVENSLSATDEEFPTLEDLRICIYRTARNFCADIWRADTSRMVNQAIEPRADEEIGEHINRDAVPDYVVLDQIVRTLKPDQREVLLLKIRSDFPDDATGDIIGIDAAVVKSTFRHALDIVRERCRGKVAKYEFRLVELPLHPVPQEAAYGNTNLSMLIGDLKESRSTRFRSSWGAFAVVVVVAVLGLIMLFRPVLMAFVKNKLR